MRRLRLAAGEPADLIDLVDRHVDDDASACAAKPGGGRRCVPLPARDHQEVTEAPASQLLPKLDELGDEAAPVADLERNACALRGLRGGIDVRRAHATRLLAQDRKAALGALGDEPPVKR